MPATVKLLQTFKVTLIMVTFVHNFTVSVPPVCSDAYFLQCLDMTCIQAMDAVMMDLPHLGAKRASAPSLVNPPPLTMCPREWWLNPAMLNHNWILLLPSCSSVPKLLMEIEWVLQQIWNIICTCLNYVNKSSPAVPRRVGVTTPKHAHRSTMKSVSVDAPLLLCLFVDTCV